jgi:glycosyltransferase involved in cell wall biosynthesis
MTMRNPPADDDDRPGADRPEADEPADFSLAVLQVLPSLVTGGVERGTVDVAAAVVAAGGTAVVASAGGPMVRELERAGATHVTLPLDTKNPFRMRRNVDLLADLIARTGIDVVHARSRAPAWSAHAAARRTGRPFVTTFHGTYNFRSFLKRRYNAVMTKADTIIAISRFIADHIRQHYRPPDARIVVIERGIDFGVFDPAGVPAARVIKLAEAWRLPDGVPVVMLPGRLTRWKGQAVFLDALAALGGLDAMAVIVGDDQGRTRYRAELERQIARLGLGARVRLVDHCRDMPAAYMLSDVVVSASTDPEAFGRVLVEAQAMGRMAIGTDHGGARETVIVGETGWLVPPGDAPALARAIRDALGLSEPDRRRIAEAAMRHARMRFGKPLMCARTLAVYRDVAARARKSGG